MFAMMMIMLTGVTAAASLTMAVNAIIDRDGFGAVTYGLNGVATLLIYVQAFTI